MITIEYFLLFCCLQSDSSNFEKHEMQGVSKYQKWQVILKKKVVKQLWNFDLFFNKIIVGFFSSFLMATFFKSRCNAMTSIFDINNEELCKKKINNQRKPSRRRMILNFPQGSFWATLLCYKNSGMSGDHFQISDWYL